MPTTVHRFGPPGAVSAPGEAWPALLQLPPPVRFASSAHRLYHFCRDVLAAHGVRTHCEGQLPDGPAVLLAAHGIGRDPLVVMAGTPCLPVSSSVSWPILEPALRTLALDTVDRRDRARRVLAAGTSILGFETRPGGPFERALLLAARSAAAPVVPVAVCPGDSTSIVFGPALDPASFPDAPSLGRAASAILVALHDGRDARIAPAPPHSHPPVTATRHRTHRVADRA